MLPRGLLQHLGQAMKLLAIYECCHDIYFKDLWLIMAVPLRCNE